jgi:uncharacterized protein (DUF983 family)
MVIPKKNKLYSILYLKCPRCNEGDLFVHKSAYSPLKESISMPLRCSFCGLKFEKETGFYYGAMYVSYGLNVGLSVALFLFFYLFFWQFPIHYFLIADALFILATFPVITRISRAIWINLFIRYQEPGSYAKDSNQ